MWFCFEGQWQFQGRLLAIDPHRVCSFSKRHMRVHRNDDRERPTKTAQTFFALDADTGQPICFTTGTSARTAAVAAEELLKLAGDILGAQAGRALVLADSEHFTVDLLDRVKTETNFDLLVPMPNRRGLLAKLRALPPDLFRPRWAGYATAKRLAPPTTTWDAKHMATALFAGLEGDVRVQENTIIVTYYNSPDAEKLRAHYEDLPAKLWAEKIDPRIPWLYGFELDFRFR